MEEGKRSRNRSGGIGQRAPAQNERRGQKLQHLLRNKEWRGRLIAEEQHLLRNKEWRGRLIAEEPK